MLKTEILVENDFLSFERNSDVKHELIFNDIFEMSGASKEHNKIAHNLAGLCYILFRDNFGIECFHNDLRVFNSMSRSYCYPDLILVEGESLFVDDQFDTLTNPVFIAEVLSSSTEKRDQIEKFEILKEYPIY